MISKTSWVVLFTAVIGLAGCDQMKSQFDDWFGGPTPEKVVSKMKKSLADGKVADAIAAGEKFVGKNPDPDNKVREELVRLYLSKNDASGAMRHMEGMATGGTSGSSSTVSIITVTPPAAQNSAPKTQSNSETVISADGASVRIGPGGTEVRAGDAVVRTPK
jgi:hypothetical protein